VVEIYDTTLRDGAQAEGISFSIEDKLRIVQELDSLGIHYIEGGYAGSNPKDEKFFERARELNLKNAKLAAFGSTRRAKRTAVEDRNMHYLLETGTKVVTVVGKSWDLHVTKVLRVSLKENLAMIEDSVKFLADSGREVIFDAEHFFDGYKDDAEYALKTIEAAARGGADCIVLCDTRGGTMPLEVKEMFEAAAARVDVPLGIHAHDDAGMAAANSIIAVQCGAVQVHGTFNGYGERCGNGNLTSIMPSLALKMGYTFHAALNLKKLSETSRYVNELANLPHNRYQPYVGTSAFAHKGGIHVSAVKRNPLTYEHIEPENVGNVRRILISDQSGRSNVLHKAKKFGIDLDTKDPVVTSILKELKTLENQGFQYEGAEASFELLMRRALGAQRRYFTLLGFRVINQKSDMDQPPQAEATIRLEVGGEMVHTAALGEGPVNALDNALRKALTQFYPSLSEMWLDDYRVRVLASDRGTGARVRVLVESRDGESEWGTVGVSHDILEASWQALVDSITYKLMKDERKKS